MPLGRLGQALTAKEIHDLVKADLGKVESEMGLETLASVDAITYVGKYLRESGGKRIRPTILLLCAKMLAEATPLSIKLGAVVEMIHSATLVHDDVIDESSTRRGRPSVNSVWGNTVAVLSGDWLYMQAFQISLRERNFRLLDILMTLTQTMVEGELLQLEWLGRADLTEEDYLNLVDRKTACLFSACARLGALSVGVNGDVEQKLGDFGWNLGMAFQLVDDILDYTANESRLGKPVGEDLREGKVTLPLIYTMQAANGSLRPLVDRILKDRSYRQVPLSEIMKAIYHERGFDRAMARAEGFLDTARNLLNELPDNQYQRALHSVLDLVVERDH